MSGYKATHIHFSSKQAHTVVKLRLNPCVSFNITFFFFWWDWYHWYSSIGYYYYTACDHFHCIFVDSFICSNTLMTT